MDIKYFEEKLNQEREKLITELESVARRNPDNTEDWEAIQPSMESNEQADPNDKADVIESYETNTAILKQLETQLKDVEDALEKIKEGKYGICEISGDQIEEGRLEANPAARTCIKHMKD